MTLKNFSNDYKTVQDVYSSNQNTSSVSKNGAQTSISKPSGQETVKSRSKRAVGPTHTRGEPNKNTINSADKTSPKYRPSEQRSNTTAASRTAQTNSGKSIEKNLSSQASANSKPQSTFQELGPDFKQLQNLKERFINRLMLKGQKALARNIFFKSLAVLAELNTDKRVEKAGKSTLKKSSLWSFSPAPLKRAAMAFTALKTPISTKAVINLHQTKSRINKASHLPKLKLARMSGQADKISGSLIKARELYSAPNSFTPQDDLFLRAIENVKPYIELKSKRVAGSTFKIPFQIQPSHRQYSLAVRWLILAARQRPERHMINKLAAELFDAANSRGHAIKNKIEMHRSAEANRAYLHFRW